MTAFDIFLIICCGAMAGIAFYINESWHKEYLKMNEKWYKFCTDRNNSWDEICSKLNQKIKELESKEGSDND